MKARYSGNIYVCNECWNKYFYPSPNFAMVVMGFHKCTTCGMKISNHGRVIDVLAFYQVFPPEKFGYLMEKE